MKQEALTKLALDCQDFLCYISDTETYELYYINQALKDAFGIVSDEEYLGKLCYKVLQHKDSPCEFCNNSQLALGEKIIWEVDNPVANARYSLVDTLINYNGREARVELAFDISNQHKRVEFLSQKLSMDETLMRCVHALMNDSKIGEAVISLLSIIGEFYSSENAFLYEIEFKEKNSYNAYRWLNPQFPVSHINHEKLSYEEVQFLLQALEEKGEIFASNTEEDLKANPDLYKLVKNHNCESLMIVPLLAKNRIIGFIGIGNMKRQENLFSLLHSVARLAHDDIIKRRLKNQLEFLSYTDSLTGLGNRNKFNRLIEEIEANTPQSLGIIYIDVNGLKKANDLYGHDYGDYVLKRVAKELFACIGENVFRVAGDEFVALCPDIRQEEFEELMKDLRQLSEDNEEITFSVGSEWQGKNINVLRGITHSDEVMYAQKQNYYKSTVSDGVPRRTNAVEIVLFELQQGYFTLYLQPKVVLKTGKIVEAEALVRKRSETGGIVSPEKFIPIYEHDGTIKHLDFYVLEQVCILLQNLIAEGKPLKISVNFSRVTFMQFDLVDEIVRIAAQYNVPHKFLQIEITESIDKMDIEFFGKKLLAIQDAGFGISLDDFGARYSNLVMLLVNHFTEIKIDKSLVDNISTSPQNRIIIRHLIEMVEQLNVAECIAEGIETEEQRDILIEYGCSYGQGYLFYRPMQVADFISAYYKNIEEHKD